MGEFPARFVASDFLTPPELAAWRLAREGSGRIGGVRIGLAQNGGATHLTSRYEQIPVRVLPLNLGPDQPTLVYLLNPTAGLMDGDAHRMEIDAGPGTRAVVTGQSATRIHPSLHGFCTQQWQVTVADGAILVVMPGPAIPFHGCRYFQSVDIELGQDARLIWGDIWFAGRYARQEVSELFQFSHIVQEMHVKRKGKLVYRDRFHWSGPWDDETARWHFGGAPAAGMLFATGSHEDACSVTESTRTAAFLTAAGDTCMRCTGPSEGVVRHIVENCLRLAALLANGSRDAPWLLAGHHLARTHWFDVAS